MAEAQNVSSDKNPSQGKDREETKVPRYLELSKP